MEFRVLGPIEAWSADRPVELGGGKPRALLGALLVERGRVVPVNRLIDAIWDERPPATARALVQTYVSGLRNRFKAYGGGSVILTKPWGYLADLAAPRLDRDVFLRTVGDARAAAGDGRHHHAAALYREALSLWRGPALVGATTGPLRSEAARLDELRLEAVEERVAVDLAVGRLAELAGELAALLARHPLRERLRGQLMITLFRLGRQADALAVYREGRRILRDELGVEPGVELSAVHSAVLRGDARLLGAPAPAPPAPAPATSPASAPAPTTSPASASPASASAPTTSVALTGGRTGSTTAAAGTPVTAQPTAPSRRPEPAPPRPLAPAQLPPAPGDYTGRADELAALLASAASAERSGRMPVHVVTGAAGVGKTALALHAAHQLAAGYPDGQLYAQLGGTADAAAEPAAVLAALLRTLGAPAGPLPDSVAERAAQMRTLLSGRRVLLLLDDARDEEQIGPLLPGAAGCAVLITSRNRLAGLPVTGRTEPDVLPVGAATELLAGIAGDDRVRAEPEAARRIVVACDGLPLAVRIAGARLAARRRWPLTVLADRLAAEHRRLDELTLGSGGVRASLEPAHRGLSADARAALGWLGRSAAADFAAWVLAPALRVGEVAAEALVEALADAHLLTCTGVDGAGQVRYRMPGLVRLYARERAADPADDVQALAARVAELATRASPAWSDELRMHRPQPPAPAVTDLDRLVGDRPRQWVRAERLTVAAAVTAAAARGDARMTVHLAATLRAACGPDAAAVRPALRTAGDDPDDRGLLMGEEGLLELGLHRPAGALPLLRGALDAFTTSGNRLGQARTLAALGAAGRRLGRCPEAQHLLDRATVLAGADDPVTAGWARRQAALAHLDRGDPDAAGRCLAAAQEHYRAAGSERGVAAVLRVASRALLATGDPAAAQERAEQARDVLRRLGDEDGVRDTDRELAAIWAEQGRHAPARPVLEEALTAARSGADPARVAAAGYALGRLHLLAGRTAAARDCLREARSAAEVSAQPVTAARIDEQLADAYDRGGDVVAAAALRVSVADALRVYGAAGPG
ncbi:AfsR/SARP family transcriptional regulator [Actinoplanes teichomyceticus]|uniref:DNA-binding SARP family transcriptional activator n=1 Tax=Actinoplanes teichomyceticus TaxID=1867 RepID=A0A561VJ07_ACTTI|nr:AfsR/SARP family transcriptional regulator [Actinoplanes teichomyceticus]TWG11580.1 DNA-binding SARP family transcriptional activator [Actinoplanes teichomyceticus]GIF16025.1 hypothetical protein Ate01nite_60570 [Actinoplanes teichomyceticus]